MSHGVNQSHEFDSASQRTKIMEDKYSLDNFSSVYLINTFVL